MKRRKLNEGPLMEEIEISPLEYLRVREAALEKFGDMNKFKEWLKGKSIKLGPGHIFLPTNLWKKREES